MAAEEGQSCSITPGTCRLKGDWRWQSFLSRSAVYGMPGIHVQHGSYGKEQVWFMERQALFLLSKN